ncbi:MAG: hypothetical protein Ct9H300mP1_21040 [Planctomycetaceae bacterium]|nr:MAG: hypothetical protein Ct9H300mP1_21040 [Planctomycetaceae bacterium]
MGPRSVKYGYCTPGRWLVGRRVLRVLGGLVLVRVIVPPVEGSAWFVIALVHHGVSGPRGLAPHDTARILTADGQGNRARQVARLKAIRIFIFQ